MAHCYLYGCRRQERTFEIASTSSCRRPSRSSDIAAGSQQPLKEMEGFARRVVGLFEEQPKLQEL